MRNSQHRGISTAPVSSIFINADIIDFNLHKQTKNEGVWPEAYLSFGIFLQQFVDLLYKAKLIFCRY
ncbi:hypothetical protein CXF72_14465 [Psychromonas sp. MB-3u-54]|nr:hypothetical protein CXF72_14465 [Psychromonas sp. MB-3u-54]